MQEKIAIAALCTVGDLSVSSRGRLKPSPTRASFGGLFEKTRTHESRFAPPNIRRNRSCFCRCRRVDPCGGTAILFSGTPPLFLSGRRFVGAATFRDVMHILLIEDDPFIARAVTAALESEAHTVTYAPTGKDAFAALAVRLPDAVLLDLGLPGIDGIDVLKSIRAMPAPASNLPVIIVTAREALESRLEGLDAGADDYILKPFHMSELLARLRAVVRRKGPLAGDVLRAGHIALNTVTHTCTVGSDAVTLSKREYALLAALLVRPGAILSRRALEEKLYAPGDEPESNAIEYLIHALRKKIGSESIENIRGLGWRIKAEQ